MLDGWTSEDKAAADAHDAAIKRAIEDAITLQESDPDDGPADSRVLAALRAALKAQEADETEEGAASMKTCPTCEGSGKVAAGGAY